MSQPFIPQPYLIVIGARAQFVDDARTCKRSDLRYYAPSTKMPAIVDGVLGTVVRDDSPHGWTFAAAKAPRPTIRIRVRNGQSELDICRADGSFAVIASCNLATGECSYHCYTGVTDGVWRSRGSPDGYDLSCNTQDPEYNLSKALAFLDFSRRAPALERAA